jgi:signal peptidase I
MNTNIKNDKKDLSSKEYWLDFIKELLIIIGIVVMVEIFIIQPFLVPTGSMIPTIQENDRILALKFTYYIQKPNRGDIVVFQSPPSSHLNAILVKRMIGLPGDTISVVKNKGVFINGKFLEEPYVKYLPDYDMPPVKLGEDEYFMMGDNKSNSADSHIWGPLSKKYLIGKAVARFWPLNNLSFLK